MAPLQPPTNFKYKFFWGALVLKNYNLASSSSNNVVSINLMLMRVLPIEVLEQKIASKGKNMKFIEPFRMFCLISYHGLNQWLEVMVLLTKCIAKCAQPLKTGKDY